MKYAALGSDELSPEQLSHMTNISMLLAMRGFTMHIGYSQPCRTGDRALLTGCNAFKGARYARCDTFQNKPLAHAKQWYEALYGQPFDTVDKNMRAVYASYHLVLLGDQLNAPVDFVVIWPGMKTDQCAYVERFAQAINIPVFTMNTPMSEVKLWQFLQTK